MPNKFSRLRSVFDIRFARFFSAVFTSACVLVTGASGAHAQSAFKSAESKGPLTIVLTQSKVVSDNQREVLADASKVKPGDIIEYRARYTNTGKQPVTRLVATLPLAAGLELLPQSARPAQPAPTATANDGIYAAMPLMRKVTGKAQPEPVPYSEYRGLRWNVGQLNAGGVFEAVARVRVVSNADAQPVSVSSVAKPAEVTAKP